MPNVRRILDERVTAALRAAFPDAPDAPAIVTPSQEERFGDYQANGAMGLAKRLKRKPRDVAEAVLARLDVSDLAEKPEIAGPGFINLRLKADWVAQQLGAANQVRSDPKSGPVPGRPEEDRLGVPRADRPETVVVDYSAPNLAKEMHVGHLRSTIIGDALVRMLEFAGHTAIRQNHVGDWGTQFGMLVCHLMDRIGEMAERNIARGVRASATSPGAFLADMECFYREAKSKFDKDPGFAGRSRQCVVRLQAGDANIREWWEEIVASSMSHCERVYDRLGVTLKPRDIRGESAYNDVLPDIVEALREKGLLSESQGAQCVFLNDAQGKPFFKTKEGDPLPLIVQKSDEGYLYATTDLAALAFRTGRLPPSANPQSAIRNSQSPRADRILYVVDARQALHFQMLFECAYQAGF
jgi:arginyl-tRNA synthetase